MNTIEDRINEFIDDHPKECLSFIIIVVGMLWQSVATLLALIIYCLYPYLCKYPRWWMVPVGAVMAVIILILGGHLDVIDFINSGFIHNFTFLKLLLIGAPSDAVVYLVDHELNYSFGFSILIAGLLSLVELINRNPHELTMRRLQKAELDDKAIELDKKTIDKKLKAINETLYDATVLGVSKQTGKVATIPDHYLNQIAIVLGTTGAGKTVTLRRFYKRAITKGYPLIIVDGKPDDPNIQWVKVLAENFGRKFYGFNCGNYQHYDPLANGGYTELKDKIVCLKDEWSSDYYRSIAESYLQTAIKVLLSINHHIDLSQIMECLNITKLVGIANKTKDTKLMRQVARLKQYDAKDITGLQAHLDILINSEIGYFFDRDESSFSLSDVINSNSVVYFALPALKYPSFSKVLGKLVINDIKSVIEGRVHGASPIFTIFDEFSVFAGEQVLNLVNMGRGKGIHAIFGTQGLADLARVSDRFQSQVLNCVNTILCHRLNDQESAEAVAKWVGTKEVFTVTAQLDVKNGLSGLGSVRGAREYTVHPDDIKQRLRVGEVLLASKIDDFLPGKVVVKCPFS